LPGEGVGIKKNEMEERNEYSTSAISVSDAFDGATAVFGFFLATTTTDPRPNLKLSIFKGQYNVAQRSLMIQWPALGCIWMYVET
jgi:hypothetical protein